MIKLRLHGGLGNQMFQYAAAYSLATRLGTSVHIDLGHFLKSQWAYQLDAFELNSIHKLVSGEWKFSNALRHIRRRISPHLYYFEPHFHYDPAVNQIADGVEMFGYFQTSRYFSTVQADIRKAFRQKTEVTGRALEWTDEIAGSANSVSLHIRRGDYISDHKASQVHASISMQYYERALRLVSDIRGGPLSIFLFSDDADFARALTFDTGKVKVVSSTGLTPHSELSLMSSCRDNIIANSSFSWWGAWLNLHRENIVIAPARWFTSDRLSSVNVVDVYEEDWIILK